MDEAVVLPMQPAPDAIELRHLRAFVAVAEELNFSRAAERLYVSQPALSRQIRALERLVGCPLLRRSTHRVELTLAGEALLTRAGQLIDDLDTAIAATRSVGGEHAERLTRLWAVFVDVNTAGGNMAGVRAAVEELHAKFPPPAEVEVTAANAGGVPALRCSPPDPAGAPVLFLHGGGHISGSAFGYRHLAGALAMVTRRQILVPEYRLAPEHPFPAPLDDARSAYLSLLADGTPAEQVAVAGDSSGAGLVLSLLLALRDEGHPPPGRAVLMCPWIDLGGGTREIPADGSPLIITPDATAQFAELYLSGHPADDPLVTPLDADLSGLPPLLVQAGTGDNLVNEARLLAERAAAAGVDVSLELYPVATHDFHLFWTFLPEAADALHRAGEFLGGTGDLATAAGE
ncbi:MAG TPA: alpha/beta hydrolase fold domain-containing protein [Mycobacteriales bacterium]|nr:alpha/beta hydrolase fold domain-containing protein [Mycobacteriales bacterium]